MTLDKWHYLSSLIWVAAYGQKAGPARACIKINLRYGCAVNKELFWILISQSKYFLDHFDIRDALGLEKVIFWTPPEDLALSTRGPLHLLAASNCRARNSLFLICRASTTELKRKTTAMSEKNTVESVLLVPMVLSWGPEETWEFKLKLI